MNISTEKNYLYNSICDAEIYVAKKITNKNPILHWNKVYDSQDNISYVVEFGEFNKIKEIQEETKTEKYYTDIIPYEGESKVYLTVPIELEDEKIYRWRVKSFDGYEYSDYSKYQYIQYTRHLFSEILSFINVETKNRKYYESTLLSNIIVNEKKLDSCLGCEIFVDKTSKFILSEINVLPPSKYILNSFIEVKKRHYDFLESELYINTKKLLPPKGPLLVDMQSEFDYVTGNMRPILSWWKSLDELFCENIVYEIQIEKNQLFIEPIYFKARNIKNPISNQMVYPIPTDLDEGIYYWRVRATDGVNFSDWIYGPHFTIDSSIENLESEIYVTNKLIREELFSEITIKEKSTLESKINVFGFGDNFLPATTVVWAKESEMLNSELYIYINSLIQNLESEIYIGAVPESLESYLHVLKNGYYSSYEKLQSKINVKYREDKEAKINVLKPSDDFILSNIDIYKQKTSSMLGAELNVIEKHYYESQDVIEAEIKIIKKPIFVECEDFISSRINVYEKIKLIEHIESEILVNFKNYEHIESEILVNSIKLSKINVYSNKNSDDWYSDGECLFLWEPIEEDKNKICGYIMNFNKNPEYIPIIGQDYYEHAGGTNMFKTKIFDNSGEYYFHIISFDKYYRTSPVSHYKVRYNNKPSIPEELKINGNVLIQENKLISKNEINIFSWEECFDIDENDLSNIKYEMMICNDPNFDNPEYTSELLDENKIELSFESYLFSGTYYWKVRSFDGKQYSDWSKISSFIINTAPTTPTDIRFFEKNK